MDEAGYESVQDIMGLSLKYLKSSKDLQLTDGCVEIDEDKCTTCMECVGLGHCDALVEEDGRVKVVQEECVACGICIGICPVEAISMREL